MQIIYRAISSPSRFPLKNCPGSLRGADIAIAASIIIPDTASAVPAYTIKIPKAFHSLRDFSLLNFIYLLYLALILSSLLSLLLFHLLCKVCILMHPVMALVTQSCNVPYGVGTVP